MLSSTLLTALSIAPLLSLSLPGKLSDPGLAVKGMEYNCKNLVLTREHGRRGPGIWLISQAKIIDPSVLDDEESPASGGPTGGGSHVQIPSSSSAVHDTGTEPTGETSKERRQREQKERTAKTIQAVQAILNLFLP